MDELIISTKDRAGTFDAIESAKPGEGLFTLQAGDPLSPPSILHWAGLARAAALLEPNAEKARKLLRKASAAEEVAWTFMAYQRGEEAMAERRATYNDQEHDGSDASVALARATDRLHNSVAECTLVAESLAKLRLHPEAEVKIREAVAAIKDTAFEIEPRHQLRRERADG